MKNVTSLDAAPNIGPRLGGELLRRRALLRCEQAHTNGPIPFLRRGSAAGQRFRVGAGQQFIPVPYRRAWSNILLRFSKDFAIFCNSLMQQMC
jgi:hypothetical protein